MRHLILILMIALLPLRGWAGDVMATGMAAEKVQQMQQERSATESIATQAHPAIDTAGFDHASAVHVATPAVADCAGHGAEVADASHCDTCSACQACHTVAIADSAPAVPPTFQAFAPPQAAAYQFASADAALRQKPPIS